MKRVFVIVVALGLLAISAQIAGAQSLPFLQVFFDDLYTVGSMDCPGAMPDSAYVVAKNFNMYMQGIEYKVAYPAEMVWLADNVGTALAIGNTSIGIAQAWPLPQNAYVPFSVAKVLFFWNCTGCPIKNIPIVVVPHPETFKLRALRWPDLLEVNIVGSTSLVCATIPVEESSWGQIKALYK
ncbi:MAG: hypothetical protein ABIA59_10940 [Candidatus Latescibacterota bacterium]